MAAKARTWEDVQQPMEYESKWEDQPYRESTKELGRQKGFRQAKSVDDVIKPYIKKSVKPNQEIDAFMQWEKPREAR